MLNLRFSTALALQLQLQRYGLQPGSGDRICCLLIAHGPQFDLKGYGTQRLEVNRTRADSASAHPARNLLGKNASRTAGNRADAMLVTGRVLKVEVQRVDVQLCHDVSSGLQSACPL